MQVSNKHMRKCSTSLAIKKGKSKQHWDYISLLSKYLSQYLTQTTTIRSSHTVPEHISEGMCSRIR
jgi:hypothetical protein